MKDEQLRCHDSTNIYDTFSNPTAGGKITMKNEKVLLDAIKDLQDKVKEHTSQIFWLKFIMMVLILRYILRELYLLLN